MLLTIITAWFANGTASATTMTVRDFNAGHALFFDTCTVDLVSVQPFGGEQALTARCEGESTLPIGRPMWTGMIFDEVAVDLRDWQGCALVLWLREAGNEHIEFDCGGVPLHSDGFE